MRRHIWRLPAAALFALLVGLAAGPPAAQAATFTVDSTGDGPDALLADATCADAGGACTLRAAIEQANFLPGPDVINFNIPGAGPHTIQPATPLPEITDQITIDGYTEPGASPNTNPFASGTNAVLMIELNGALTGGAGLHISAGLSTVRGLAINGFSSSGILVESATAISNEIAGNFIGTDDTGTIDAGNGVGVHLMGAPSNTIGGLAPAARNLISGNGTGIRIQNLQSSSALVLGNYVGTNAAGTQAIPNSADGVQLLTNGTATIGGTAAGAANLISGNGGNGIELSQVISTQTIQGNLIGTRADGQTALANVAHGVGFGAIVSTNAAIGGTPAGAPNVIAFNGGDGIGKNPGALMANAQIRHNSIYSNTGAGIQIDGPAAPDLTAATSTSTDSTVNGTLAGNADTDYALDFIANPQCDPTGFGEGQLFIGDTTVTTDGSGNATFSAVLPVGSLTGKVITATATSDTGDTSDFSNCRVVPGPANDDDADGVRDDAEANCGGDPTNPNIRPERIDSIFAGVSDDGDADIDEALPPASSAFDCDGDGYRGASEDHVYSYLGQLNGDQKVCQEYDSSFPNPALHVRPSKRWPADLASGSFSGNKINIQDLAVFTNPIRYINKDVGSNPGDVRLDLVPGSTVGNDITVADMATITSGATGFPVMFGAGVRAFNGPQCPYTP